MENNEYSQLIQNIVEANPDLQRHEGVGKIEEALMLISLSLGIPLINLAKCFPHSLRKGRRADNDVMKRSLTADKRNPQIQELNAFIQSQPQILEIR